MTGISQAQKDGKFEIWMAFLLRGGVIAAALFVMAGAVIVFSQPALAPDYKVFHGQPANLCRYAGIVKELLALNGLGTIQFGLLLLIATPAARVGFSILIFVWERDYIYVLVTAIVFAALIWSLIV